MDLNIVQLYKSIVERQKRSMQAFDKVVAACHNHIRNVNNVDGMKCLYRVPEFVWGVPPYNLEECIKHLISRLEGGGFHVKYYFPNILFISWDIADLEKEKEKEIASPSKPKSLENLKLVEDKKRVALGKPKLIKKPQGRFTLTLAQK